MELARGGRAVDINMDSDSSDDDEDGEFYTEGTDDLLEARRKLATYSLQR
jgi:U4/U6 small nuclear ribonucleoprotein PRP4